MDIFKSLLIELKEALEATFEKDEEAMELEIASDIIDIMEQMAELTVDDIISNSPKTGISFPVVRSAFRYIYVKAVDNVLIYKQEKTLQLGRNTLYDFEDIIDERYGVSEYFDLYGKNPDDEVIIGEEYFYSLQDFIVKNKKLVINSRELFRALLTEGLKIIIPFAVKRGLDISGEEEPKDAEELCLLAIKYLNGEGVKQDLQLAASLFRKSAEQGNARAQKNLGLCFLKGMGVSRNLNESFHWLNKAADQGDAEAIYNVGVNYYLGMGVKKDTSKALSLFQRAAEGGFIDAQFNLGVIFEEGVIIEKDLERAKYWFAKAAEQGDKEAQIKVNKIRGSI